MYFIFLILLVYAGQILGLRSFACQSNILHLECPSGFEIKIHNAFYGRDNDIFCPGGHLTERCSTADSKSILRHWCDGLQKCNVYASSENFGNPCHYTRKYLIAYYSCVRRSSAPVRRIPFHTMHNFEIDHTHDESLEEDEDYHNDEEYDDKEETVLHDRHPSQRDDVLIKKEARPQKITTYDTVKTNSSNFQGFYKKDEEYSGDGTDEAILLSARIPTQRPPDANLIKDKTRFQDFQQNGNAPWETRSPLNFERNGIVKRAPRPQDFFNDKDTEDIFKDLLSTHLNQSEVNGTRFVSFSSIQFSRDYTVTVCEGRDTILECDDDGEILRIESASYGRHNAQTCATNKTVSTIDCHADSSDRIVRRRCDGKQSCYLSSSNRVFGNPCPGTRKYLTVNYTCEGVPPASNHSFEKFNFTRVPTTNLSLLVQKTFNSSAEQPEPDENNSNIKRPSLELEPPFEESDTNFHTAKDPYLENSEFQSNNPQERPEVSPNPSESNTEFQSSFQNVKPERRPTVTPSPSVPQTQSESSSQKPTPETRPTIATSPSVEQVQSQKQTTRPQQRPTTPTVADDAYSKYACQNDLLTLECPNNRLIAIDYANYGRTDTRTCSFGYSHQADCRSLNTASLISNRCGGLIRCRLQAESDIFGDPCPTTFKYLEVHYRCILPPY